MIGGDVLDEGTIHFQSIHREALQIAQARVARTEIVDRNLDAELLELDQHAPLASSASCMTMLSVSSISR